MEATYHVLHNTSPSTVVTSQKGSRSVFAYIFLNTLWFFFVIFVRFFFSCPKQQLDEKDSEIAMLKQSLERLNSSLSAAVMTTASTTAEYMSGTPSGLVGGGAIAAVGDVEQRLRAKDSEIAHLRSSLFLLSHERSRSNSNHSTVSIGSPRATAGCGGGGNNVGKDAAANSEGTVSVSSPSSSGSSSSASGGGPAAAAAPPGGVHQGGDAKGVRPGTKARNVSRRSYMRRFFSVVTCLNHWVVFPMLGSAAAFGSSLVACVCVCSSHQFLAPVFRHFGVYIPDVSARVTQEEGHAFFLFFSFFASFFFVASC